MTRYAQTLCFLITLCCCSPIFGQPKQVELPAKERFHLYLLVGQSNMAGRGKVSAADKKPHPRVLMLDKQGRWVPAVAPLHFDKPRVVGVGLGRTFAIELADEDPSVTVGLIPCAAGGSPISSWEPGGYHGQTKSHPYDDAWKRAMLALPSGTLKGILWHQGESDSKESLAPIYEQKLHALIARFRSELQAPHVPFIAGQMGQFAERPWNDPKKKVDAAHRRLPQQVANTAFVSSDGLRHKGDEVHFSAESYRELGRRYASAYRRLRSSPQEPLSHILFGSCAKQSQPMPIFETIMRHNPDVFLFLGDNIYADTTDMEVMRRKYAQLGADAGFQKLCAGCPIMATWDDHDYGANDAGSEYPHRDAAQRIFADFWKDPADSPRRSRPGVYEARMFGPPGKRVQVIMLDTRYFRSPLKKGEQRVGGAYVPLDDPSATMLGESQWKWLEQQLKLPAELRIVASSIQFVAQAAGQETWSNLPRERQRMMRLIHSTGAEGIVFVSGDRHWSEISRTDEAGTYPLYDVTASAFNQIHPRGTPTENRFRAIASTYHHPNFGHIHVDWSEPDPTIRLQIRDLEGSVRIEHKLKLSQLQLANSGN